MMKNENPFKSVGYSPKEVPDHLKKEIMNTVNIAKSLMEISSAFTSKHKEVMSALFKTKRA